MRPRKAARKPLTPEMRQKILDASVAQMERQLDRTGEYAPQRAATVDETDAHAEDMGDYSGALD